MIRIRHPNGVATVAIQESTTWADLQKLIHSASEIPPEAQDVKAGFPPKSISAEVSGETLISNSSVGIKKGDQVIVARGAGGSAPAARPSSSSGTAPVSAPASSASGTRPPQQQAAPSTGPKSAKDAYKMVGDEYLRLHVVADDNSCLFASIGCVLQRRTDVAVCDELRNVVADVIRSRPDEYSEAVLGEPPASYARKILSPRTWGGGIELRIFSDHFRVEINSVDIETGRVDRYGEEQGYAQKVFLAYSGIHYDALVLLPMQDAPLEFATTVFDRDQAERILPSVQELSADLKKMKYYTSTATFTLRCKQCGERLVGEKGVVQHGMKTGHSDFEEYS